MGNVRLPCYGFDNKKWAHLFHRCIFAVRPFRTTLGPVARSAWSIGPRQPSAEHRGMWTLVSSLTDSQRTIVKYQQFLGRYFLYMSLFAYKVAAQTRGRPRLFAEKTKNSLTRLIMTICVFPIQHTLWSASITKSFQNFYTLADTRIVSLVEGVGSKESVVGG